MKPVDALIELFGRVAVLQGVPAVINADELAEWPLEAVSAIKAQKLILKARPTSSAVCPGCEEESVMPVQVIPRETGNLALFIACDKRDDISRVPEAATRLEQWKVSGDSIADVLASLLDLRRTNTDRNLLNHWEIGTIECRHDSDRLTLVIEGSLSLVMADQIIPLSQILSLNSDGLHANRQSLLRMLDDDDREPTAGKGSPSWRKQQARKAADALHNKPGGSREKQRRTRRGRLPRRS